MNNICVLPFNSISVDATGVLRPCCSSGGDAFFNTNVNDNVNSFQILNNPDVVNLRQQFIAGEKPDACRRCWHMESIGTDSFRNISNNKSYGLKDNKVIQIKPEVDFSGLQFLDITLGNKCNLACRMCHPNSSSLVAKQWEVLGKIEPNKFNLDFDRTTRNKFLEIIDRAENLDTIYMLGGEPLVNEFHDEILEYLIKTGRAKNITVQYNTNLNVDLDRYLEMWSHFKLIDLGISIDGSYETYEYIRWPGRWKKVWNNLLEVSRYNLPNIQPMIATTVQNLNIDNLYSLITDVRANTNLTFYFIPITGYNQLHFTPKHILEKALDDLRTLPDNMERKRDLVNMVESAISRTEHVDIGDYNLRQFFEMQQSYDRLRNQNLFKVKPHFVDYATNLGFSLWS